MINNAMPENAPLESETHTCFSYKSSWEHLRCFFNHGKSLWFKSVAVFGVLCGAAQASAYFLEIDLRGWQFFAAAIVVSAVAAVGWTLHVYLNDCPDGFENESAKAKRIAHLRRSSWEYRLVQQLLQDKLTLLDKELNDLLAGRIFVPIERILQHSAYEDWTQTRLRNVRRMIDVAIRLLITDFPSAIRSEEKHEAQPIVILTIVNHLRDLYAQTVAFERGNHAVAPPEGFESLHVLQRGWTTPIRNGILQLHQFLDQMTALDKKSRHYIHFTITFGSIPNIDEFCQEMDRLSAQLPNLMDDEAKS